MNILQLWRLPFFIAAWILFVAIKLPTAILGFVVVPFMYSYNDVKYDSLPGWMRPWANPEDWLGGHATFEASLPKWWVDKKGTGFKSFYQYHAVRNPANGLRSYEWLDLDIDMAKVRYMTPRLLKFYAPWYLRQEQGLSHVKTIGYICWQGFRAGVKVVHLWNEERHLVIKFGWRVEPRDASTPIDPNGLRVRDSGFASKFLPYRRG
jgi:hypothetical protein